MLKFFPKLLLMVLFQKSQQDCRYSGFEIWAPIATSMNYTILYPPTTNPPTDRNITLLKEESIIISCTGGYFTNTNLTSTKSNTIIATCNQNNQLEAQDTILDYTKIQCVNFRIVEVRSENINCALNSILIQIGFRIGLNLKFIPLIEICFDLQKRTPYFSHYKLSKSIGYIKSYLVTSYETDNFYFGLPNLPDLFSLEQQMKTINSLLGLPEDSTRYIIPETCKTTPGFCLKVRPLAYRGEFIYIPEQYATYRYLNVVPQWSFTSYNWEKLERNVIDFVKGNLDVDVYTGTYGVATLPHSVTGEEVELFLYKDSKIEALPIPLLLWKFVYDPVNGLGTGFIVINDPYQKEPSRNVICEDISDNLQWLKWEKKNVTKGYSYACSYQDMKKVISVLPELYVLGPLN